MPEFDQFGAKERADYYAHAALWADEALGSLRRSRATAWVCASAMVLLAIFNTIALLSLGPLNRTVIYPVQVEAQRGASLGVHALEPGRVQRDPVYIQSMLARYVTARAEFAASRILVDYRLVELLSGPPVRSAYIASLRPTSGTGPLSLYPASAIVDVHILSISLIDAKHALVRYTTTRADLAGAQPSLAEANVGFTFTHGPMRDLDRYDDPLGFQVTDFSSHPL